MMSWFPPALLVASGLLSLAWTAFLLFEITKAVELVVEAAASLSSCQEMDQVRRTRGQLCGISQISPNSGDIRATGSPSEGLTRGLIRRLAALDG